MSIVWNNDIKRIKKRQALAYRFSFILETGYLVS